MIIPSTECNTFLVLGPNIHKFHGFSKNFPKYQENVKKPRLHFLHHNKIKKINKFNTGGCHVGKPIYGLLQNYRTLSSTIFRVRKDTSMY